jgi:tRNA(Arg) A34 adenosine deaminase TadA
MRLAIEEAAAGLRANCGGPFGCVIVLDGAVVARGNNCVTSTNDPTAHAEVSAIREACRALGRYSLDDCTLYASCEPCPMCLAAIYWARIPRMFYANTRIDAAAIGFDDDFIYLQIALPPGSRTIAMQQLLRDEAQAAFREWQAKPDKLPY